MSQREKGDAVGETRRRLLRVDRPRKVTGDDLLPLMKGLRLVDETPGVDIGEAADLFQRPGQLVALKGFSVPAIHILDEADAFPLSVRARIAVGFPPFPPS